jgi:hypothetical protein
VYVGNIVTIITVLRSETFKEVKPLAIALCGVGRGGPREERDCGGDLTNIQCEPIWNCHNESSLHNKYILIIKKNGL